MKRITLRKVVDPDASVDLEWAGMVRQVIRRPARATEGVDIDEIRKGVRVLDAIDKSNGVLELEDADWEHLKEKTLTMRWAVVDKHILMFVDEVLLATEDPKP